MGLNTECLEEPLAHRVVSAARCGWFDGRRRRSGTRSIGASLTNWGRAPTTLITSMRSIDYRSRADGEPMDICVVALGKIAPLAVQFAQAGHRVRGADIDQATVDSINQGNPLSRQPAWKKTQIARSSGLLEATTDTAAAVAESRSSWSWFPCSSARRLGRLWAMDAAARHRPRSFSPARCEL